MNLSAQQQKLLEIILPKVKVEPVEFDIHVFKNLIGLDPFDDSDEMEMRNLMEVSYEDKYTSVPFFSSLKRRKDRIFVTINPKVFPYLIFSDANKCSQSEK